MAQNKNFVERDVKDGDEPMFETLKFNDIRRPDGGQGDWLSHIMLGYIPEPQFSEMLATPGWNPEAMQVTIDVNGVRIIHATFEAMISEFSGRMLTERLERVKFNDFEAAVKKKAENLLRQSLGDFNEKVYQLQQNLEHLADTSENLVQAAWSAPYKYHMTDEMKAAGAQTIEAFGTFIPSGTNYRVLADKVYTAMVREKPDLANTVNIKLPPAVPKLPGDFMGSADKRVVAARLELLKEVKALLESHGINAEL
jgi:hypothetical protein